MTIWTINYAVMILSAVFTTMIGTYAYMNRQERGARFLAWVMLFATLNACGTMFERVGGTLAHKLFWFNFHESAHILSIPFFLFFVMEYAGQEHHLKRGTRLPVLLYFISWAFLLWTDEYHHLLRDGIVVQDRVLMFSSTGLSFGLNIIGFMAIFASLCYLSVYAGKSGPLARKQALWVWLSAALPIVWIIAAFFIPLPPELWGVYTTVTNVALGLCMFMAIFKYKLLSTVPIAKDQIVEMMQDGVLVANDKGTVIDSNASARRLFAEFAASPVEVTGSSIRELLSPWPRWQHACERLQQDEFEIEIGQGRQAGVYTIKVLPLASAGNRKLGTVSIMSDNTADRRRYEQMEQLNRFKDELFGIVSHDIRDPLAVLLSLTEMLEEERPQMSADSAEVLDAVKVKANNTYVMVENLLEWVRCQKGGMTLLAQSTPLSLLVNEVAALLEGRSTAKNIAIRNEVPAHLEVYADREAVRLVLRNLLANAIKYTNSGGIVSIGAEETGDRVLVTVRDTGIGLLLCKELVWRSGGEIGVRSVSDEGSVFYFSLPRHAAPAVMQGR